MLKARLHDAIVTPQRDLECVGRNCIERSPMIAQAWSRSARDLLASASSTSQSIGPAPRVLPQAATVHDRGDRFGFTLVRLLLRGRDCALPPVEHRSVRRGKMRQLFRIPAQAKYPSAFHRARFRKRLPPAAPHDDEQGSHCRVEPGHGRQAAAIRATWSAEISAPPASWCLAAATSYRFFDASISAFAEFSANPLQPFLR